MNISPHESSISQSSSPRAIRRALVLGGGGSTGNAWEIGVVAGLAEVGLDVSTADLIVGTSAGATAAAMITAGADLADLFAGALSTPPSTGAPQPAAQSQAPVIDHLQRTERIIAASADAPDMRRRMGAGALELSLASDGTWSSRWRAIVGRRLPDPRWPEHTVKITAVDARTGKPVVFGRASGVELVDAVAASTASANAYEIGDGRYIDGGYRRNENADLAIGFDRVLILSPFGGRSRMPREWNMDLAVQIDELIASGSRVETISPTSDDEHMFGVNGMDLSLRPAAARSGYDQGTRLAPELIEFWK